ncbi:MAG: S9 family peptidase [Firmicutes bacterium]|nr:S9 family peptidase [Bacillota bacterium]
MPRQPFVAADILQMRFVGQPVLHPSGKEVLFVQTHVDEKENSYTATIQHWRSGKATRLSNGSKAGKVRESSPTWSPNGLLVAYLSNFTGKNQVWLKTAAGDVGRVTSLPLGVTSFVWAPDGAGLYLVAKEEKPQPEWRPGATVRRITKLRYKANGTGYLDGNPAQLWYLDLATQNITKLTEGDYDCSQPAISPCGRYLAFVSNREDDELKTLNDIWLLDLTNGEMKNLTQGKGNSSNPQWLPDGQHLLYVGHQKGIYPGGYPELRRIDVSTGENINLMPDFPHYIGNTVSADTRVDRGSTGPQITADGRYIYFVATVGGSSYLFRLDYESGEVEQVWGQGQMCITSYSVQADHLVVNVATPETPGDLWWGPIGGELHQITALNQELFADKYIGWPEVIHFTHPDGTLLEGWLIKPIGFTEGKTYPLIMEIHGGPHATFGNAFFHEWQILAGHGFGVLYTNPRGSLGYGEEFARACVGDWCGIDADDLQFMAEQAAQLPWVDEKRFGVTGGSQGGYFTNWLISHTDLFAAAVTQRSMSNLYSKYGVADNGWRGDRYGMGGRDLWDSEDFIMERSPIRYAPNVKTPTLIIHSDEDYRCPLEQAEQWYVALKRLGVTVEMLLFHGENHELSRGGRPANRIVRLEGILDWFQRYLQ